MGAEAVNIVDLFPKRKRVVGYNTTTGMRTAYALKNEGAWRELMTDIEGCDTLLQLHKCRLFWTDKIISDLWPQEWIDLAFEEFDKAVDSVARAQGE